MVFLVVNKLIYINRDLLNSQNMGTHHSNELKKVKQSVGGKIVKKIK